MARVLKDYTGVSLKTEDLNNKIDFAHIFGRSAPLNIEIGAGKGVFLINQARAQPGEDFIGIEWASRYYRYAVDRIGRAGLTNVRIIRTDAATFLTDFIQDNSVDCFHIYFPDPWPKKRHHKRRFFSQENLDNILRCLKNAGLLRIATDHLEYFEQIMMIIAARNDRLAQIDFLPTAGAQLGEWVGTNFERKYLAAQRTIYAIAVKKSK
jgi:tRNA (guanine-N7-)-methyltransferase